MHIASLYRYPVKGFSPERLDLVHVQHGEGFPVDRKYGLLRTQVDFDPAAPKWLAKANFIMLMLHERIATLKTRYVDEESAFVVSTQDNREHRFLLDSAEGRHALENFVQNFMPEVLHEAPRLVAAEGHHFTDKAAKYISLINLASLRELETRWGEPLDPLRFRANVYIDGAPPFSELDWVGQTIQLGPVLAAVSQRNGRCAATNVNPQTGVRDRNIPGKLRNDFGHKDLGVYLTATQDGVLQAGDPVRLLSAHTGTTSTAKTTLHADGKLICTACYHLFDPRTLNPSWLNVQDLPDSWRCPDCGSSRERVRAAS
ncbi:MAG: MOSC domain-containing protein [Gammaproteobacteria bacterium]|nr:MOSC domain-containing protein [Gammaproteobacteria bacterium]